MAKITLNVRTVVQEIFNVAREKTNTIYAVAGRASAEGDVTSTGVSMSSQGSDNSVLMPANAKSYPLYLHQMIANVSELRRHPNQTSRVLHFNQNNSSLMAHSIYQESMPNPNYQWQVLTDKNALAIPNQPFVFETTTPNTNQFSANGVYQRAKPVRYTGSMSSYCDPLTYGELSDYQQGDKIVMHIRSSTIPNYFRLIYDVFTVEMGPSIAASQMILTIDGAKRTLVAWAVNDSVGIALDPKNNLSKRKDRMISSRLR
jgi:hypothetical protein